MFRIDRKFVKLSSPKMTRVSTSKKDEVGAEGGQPEAATSKKAEQNSAEVESLNTSPDFEEGNEPEFETAQDDELNVSEEEIREQLEHQAEDLAKQYMSAAEREISEKSKEIIDKAREQADKITREAEKILEDAKKEASDIRDSAEKAGYDEGYAKGYEEGNAKGLEDGQRTFEEKLKELRGEDEQALKNVLEEISRENERISSELEQSTTALAVEIVRKIYNPAQEEIEDVFIKLIKNALRQMSSDNKFVIHVGPGEYERFFSTGSAEIELDSGTVITATVLRDVALEEGDLIIDTEGVTVNAGLNSQLKYVELAFERANQYEP